MSEALAGAVEELRAHLDSRELTKGVLLRVCAKRIYLGREELPGPFSEGEVDESLRLERLPDGSFGLSVRRHTGRWEQTPHSGSLSDLVEVICAQLQHLIAPW
jgi:hypothetical protein